MKLWKSLIVAGGLAIAACFGIAQESKGTLSTQNTPKPVGENSMQLGNFSVSLVVKDINASKAFYEKMDFKPVGGKLEQNWLVMQNGTTTIGLFQGMFKKNILTFNPGWDKDKKTLEKFDDVRDIQQTLLDREIKLTTKADAKSEGPASFVLADPDGNLIMFDQHVAKPK